MSPAFNAEILKERTKQSEISVTVDRLFNQRDLDPLADPED